MKVCFYTGHMNLNRKDEKKYVEIQKNDFLRNKTVRTFSSPKCFIALLVV